MRSITILCAGLFVSIGCASGPPVAQQEASSASIRDAEEMGATSVPKAALHLQLAKEQFAAAKNERNDEARAGRLLARAQADAELALALARTETERNEARDALNELQSGKSATP